MCIDIVLLTRASFYIVLYFCYLVFCFLIVLVKLSVSVQAINWKH